MGTIGEGLLFQSLLVGQTTEPITVFICGFEFRGWLLLGSVLLSLLGGVVLTWGECELCRMFFRRR